MSLEAVQLKQAGSRQQLLGGEKLVSLERAREQWTDRTDDLFSEQYETASFNSSVLTTEQEGH